MFALVDLFWDGQGLEVGGDGQFGLLKPGARAGFFYWEARVLWDLGEGDC